MISSLPCCRSSGSFKKSHPAPVSFLIPDLHCRSWQPTRRIFLSTSQGYYRLHANTLWGAQIAFSRFPAYGLISCFPHNPPPPRLCPISLLRYEMLPFPICRPLTKAAKEPSLSPKFLPPAAFLFLFSMLQSGHGDFAVRFHPPPWGTRTTCFPPGSDRRPSLYPSF